MELDLHALYRRTVDQLHVLGLPSADSDTLWDICIDLFPRGGSNADVSLVIAHWMDISDRNARTQDNPQLLSAARAETTDVADFARNNKNHQAKVKDLESQLEAVGAELRKKQQECVAKDDQTRLLEKQLASRVQQPHAAAPAATADVADFARDNKNLQTKVKALESQLEAVGAELRKKGQECVAKDTQTRLLEKQLASRAQQPQAAAPAATSDVADFARDNKNLQAKVKALESQLEAVGAELRKKGQECVAKDTQTRLLEKQLASRVQQPQAAAPADSDQVMKLHLRLKATETEREDLRGRLQQLRETLNRLQEGASQRHPLLPATDYSTRSFTATAFTKDRVLRPDAVIRLPTLDSSPKLHGYLRGRGKENDMRFDEKQFSELLLVDQERLVDELTSNPDRGKRVVVAVLEWTARTPKELATLLWNFRIDHTARYDVNLDEVFGWFFECQGFKQALRAVYGVSQGSEVVAWVLERLLTAFPYRKEGLATLIDALETKSDLMEFRDGVAMAARLKSLKSGQEQRYVIWGTHPNDNKDFQKVECLPCEEELSQPLDATRLAQLSYAHFIESCKECKVQQYLDRLFRLLREDQLRGLREAYGYVFGANSDQKKYQMAIAAELRDASAQISAERGSVKVTGRYLLPPRHPLLHQNNRRDQVTWMNESKHFFAHDSVVFLKHTGNGRIVVGQMDRGKDRKKWPQNWRMRPGSRKDPSTLEITIEVTKVLGIPGQRTASDFPCHLVATKVQWTNVALVLQSLQRFKDVIPFQQQLLNCEPVLLPEDDRTDRAVYHIDSIPQLSDRQREGLINVIHNKVTLIQGPPGTGKTHVGTHLVSTLAKMVGPVIIMAYKNHALDQLLSRVLSTGLPFNQFLRLGAGSKDPKVQEMGQQLDGDIPREDYGDIRKRRREIDENLNKLSWVTSSKLPPALKCFEIDDGEWHYWNDLYKNRNRQWPPPPDEDFFWKLWVSGKELSGKNPGDDKKAFQVLQGGPHLKQRLECFATPSSQRTKLITAVEEDIACRRRSLLYSRSKLDDHEDGARQRARAEHAVGQRFRVVGCTTSYAARNQEFIREFASRSHRVTLLVEEAGEILEPQVIACLDSGMERVVMIGDHKQLPPKVEQYDFQRSSGKGFNLNCSLFERMVEGKYPYVSLDVQHRMFPKLSKIVAALSYPELRDAQEIQRQPATCIPGLAHQLLFFDHKFPEASGGEHDNDSGSKNNAEEAKLVVKTAWYLTHQQVRPSQIAIITPYLGQVRRLRQLMQEEKLCVALNERDVEEMTSDDDEDDAVPNNAAADDQSIRISTIDNFQGEEADYVLISLVRSNNNGVVGWVKEAPRITVLLSRAKKGLVVFGNKTTFTADPKNIHWRRTLAELWPKEDVATCLSLRCNRHFDEKTEVKNAADFVKHSPEGGCRRQCAQRLPCGHLCQRRCHRDDLEHTASKCLEQKPLRCSEGHDFSVNCFESKDATADTLCPQCRRIREVEEDGRKQKAKMEQRLREKKQKHVVATRKLQNKLEQEEAELSALKEAQQQQKAENELAQQVEWKKKEVELRRVKAPEDLEKARREAEAAQERKMEELKTSLNAELAAKQQRIDDSRRTFRGQVCKMNQEAEDASQKLEQEKIRLQNENAAAIERLKQEGENKLRERRKQLEKDRIVEAENAARALEAHREQIQLEEAHIDAEGPDLNAGADALLDRRFECQVCGDDNLFVRDAAQCGCRQHRHWMHRDCFEPMIVAALNEPQVELEGEVACEYCKQEKNDSHWIIPNSLVVKFVSKEVAEKYDRHRVGSKVAKGQMATEERVKKELQDASETDRLFLALSDECNNRCPKCKKVFHDYNGCSALTCNCGAAFCAFCFADCGHDAHAHVARCPENPLPGNVFVPQPAFLAFHVLRRRRLVYDRLSQGHPVDRQKELWQRLIDKKEPFPRARPTK